MSVTEWRIDFTGQQLNPRVGHLRTTDNLATVTTAGYMNPYMQSNGFTLYTTDFIAVAASDGNQWYKPVFSASGVVTLTVLP